MYRGQARCLVMIWPHTPRDLRGAKGRGTRADDVLHRASDLDARGAPEGGTYLISLISDKIPFDYVLIEISYDDIF